jgi:hypothetical protein
MEVDDLVGSCQTTEITAFNTFSTTLLPWEYLLCRRVSEFLQNSYVIFREFPADSREQKCRIYVFRFIHH